MVSFCAAELAVHYDHASEERLAAASYGGSFDVRWGEQHSATSRWGTVAGCQACPWGAFIPPAAHDIFTVAWSCRLVGVWSMVRLDKVSGRLLPVGHGCCFWWRL